MQQPDCQHLPARQDGSTLRFNAFYGAPGIGYSATCTVCEADFAVVGDGVYDPSEQMHILDPEDII